MVGLRLRARAGLASRPFDAAAIARQAVAVSGHRRIGGLEWLSVRRPTLSWPVVALLLAIALLGAVAGIGALLREGPSVPTSRWIVFVRGGDIFVAEGDGSDQTRVRADLLWRISPHHHLRFLYFDDSTTRRRPIDASNS